MIVQKINLWREELTNNQKKIKRVRFSKI